jgi:Protein of unknown function (DUF3570)
VAGSAAVVGAAAATRPFVGIGAFDRYAALQKLQPPLGRFRYGSAVRSGFGFLAAVLAFTVFSLLGSKVASAQGGGDDNSAAAPPPPAPATPATPARVIAGWSSSEAFELASAAVAADQVGRLDECISKNQASLKLEEQPRTRLHLASCETRSGKLIDALGDSQKALTFGIQRKDVAVMRAARTRIGDLLTRIPHVTFVPPLGATDLQVFFDERAVPLESLTKRFSIDPGKHVVHAEGSLNNIPLTFDKEYVIKEGELVVVQIVLVSQAPEFLTPGQLKCMLGAKNQEDVLKCLPQNRKNLVVKAGFDMGAYSDTDHVSVFSPSINATISSPTAGWNVGGSYLVDIVTAASPDIVSEASSYYREVRNAGTLTGGYKPGLYGVQATANVSREPDYLSLGGGLALTGDFNDKRITPRLAYNYTHDTIGISSTPFSVYHQTFQVNQVEASSTFVLSPTSLILVGGTVDFERGNQSKPYRYVPLFPDDVVGRVPVGADIDLVNSVRLPMRPQENLPDQRNRYAVGVRFAHRFTSSTLRVEERLYYDSWQQVATTTDVRYLIDFARRLRVWPHVRFNAQNGANFYQLAYAATIAPASKDNPAGSISIPLYRTDDRELSPLATGTAGGGFRIALTSPEAKAQYGLSLQTDVAYTQFFNALFVENRTAIFGTISFDAEFE